ncbi:PREDICTED: uncharacterized protein LOC108372944 [Rhagoletis zephyria]|uniref:uncharacterized protein LOC108372944 n=1 Tax=Rhagoletis zephyria TaxID=28612 RepID=UPI000811820A|nr:PREDICTED: uncharacterized protein LOC108372944 [Rhagoletis zephyria]XP_017484256.1 PREDICTED: uncharacterized protein LOC108372944 [Rhagoletis zephyria]XP_017484257.1 PREDICTED: uncharacterized protein LOC108372944 [Rhagoletis zephyria]XP_017484258.1 PREDICTED: uncharacterized protein LOC108372944 [Rhagoletis zephyria]XP_017484259.1 PREDICTED: uncharacterized protein LOC108372944 [Rhagoletis zephyria]XP_017484260.1 PREDICTED: uncharacterized protein LOC108372944 [Rhagoletis zephyria]XP_01
MKVKLDAAKAKIPPILTSAMTSQEDVNDVSADDRALALKLERRAEKKTTETRHFHVVAEDTEDGTDELVEEIAAEAEHMQEGDFDENSSSHNSFDILPALSALTSTTPTTTNATRNNLIVSA